MFEILPNDIAYFLNWLRKSNTTIIAAEIRLAAPPGKRLRRLRINRAYGMCGGQQCTLRFGSKNLNRCRFGILAAGGHEQAV